MTPSEIADRLEVNEPLPICPYDRRSPEYYTTNDTDPCKFCGTKNEDGAPDLCRGADTRLFAQAAATIRAQAEALKIATEALEAAENKHLRGLFNMTVEEIDRVHELRHQALAHIKEVGA